MSIPTKLTTFMDDHHIHYTALYHAQTSTALSSAVKVDCGQKQMAKVLILEIDGKNTMCVLPSNEKLHMGILKEELGARKVKMFSENDLEEKFDDCEIGAMPAFGNLYNMNTYVSTHFQKDQAIYFNAGTHSDTVRMPYSEFIDNTEATVANFSVLANEYEDYKGRYYWY